MSSQLGGAPAWEFGGKDSAPSKAHSRLTADGVPCGLNEVQPAVVPRRVLIADDSRFARERLRQVLAPAGWQCEEAKDGAEVLQLLASGGPFHLVLLDVAMPVMNGFECLRALRERSLAPCARIMMVTAESDFRVMAEAFDCGADEFLMKPFTPESLHAKLLILGLSETHEFAF